MVKKSDNKGSLTSRASWLLLAKTFGFVFSFGLPILIVRVFDKNQIGLYQQVFLIITTVSSILTLNFGASTFYFLPREPENRNKTIFNILIFNLLIGSLPTLAALVYPGIWGLIFRDSSVELTKLAPLIGVIIWVWLFSSFLEVVAIANQEAKAAMVFIVFAQFTKSLLLFSFAWFFTTIESLLAAALIQASIQTVILLFYLKSRFPKFWLEFDSAVFRRQLVYAIPYGLAGILWVMQLELHKYFIGYYFTTEEYAIYSIGCFSLPLIGILAESVSSVTIPRMSELQKTDSRREMIELTMRVFRKLSLVYFPLYVFLMITAQTFIFTLFTDKFAVAVPIFMINITLLPLDGFILDSIARAYSEIGRFLIRIRILVFIGLTITLYFGVRYFDLRGMISIVIIANLTERLITAWRIGKLVGVRKQDINLLKSHVRIALAALSAGFVTVFVYWAIKAKNPACYFNLCDGRLGKLQSFIEGGTILAISGIFFAAVYLILIKVLNILTAEEYEILHNLRQKVSRIFFGKKRLVQRLNLESDSK